MSLWMATAAEEDVLHVRSRLVMRAEFLWVPLTFSGPITVLYHTTR